MALVEWMGTPQQVQLALHSPSHLPHEETKQSTLPASMTQQLVDVGLHKATFSIWFSDTHSFEDTMLTTSSSSPFPTWAFNKQKFSASDSTVASSSTSYDSVCLYNNTPRHHTTSITPPRYLCDLENSDNFLQTLLFLDKQGFLTAPDVISQLLQNCTDKLDTCRGRRVYLLMVSSGLDVVTSFGDCLVDLFTSCGSLQEAFIIFRKIAQPTVRSWQLLISGCILVGEFTLALNFFEQMQQDGIQPNDCIFTSILKVCGNIGAFENGRRIHNQIIGQGLSVNVFIGSTLIDMYANCHCLDEAHQVFDELLVRNVVAWNAMVGGYLKQGYGVSALKLFSKMQLEGIKPDRITF